MNVSIHPTVPAEAERLAQLQREAFRPLYERYRDEKNPHLRGAEDILRRLTPDNRYYTVRLDGETVGGILYRLPGARTSERTLGAGEYYLARVYIDPAYQGRGIARQAILLCEREFPDARAYYVDFPADMEKNRRCYAGAGYRDTGRTLCLPDTPPLTVMEKTAMQPPSPAEVQYPRIFPVGEGELEACLSVIHRSFATVADELSLTAENCPRHTSFLPLSCLETQRKWGWQMYALYAGQTVLGYMSLSHEADGAYELHNLCVLPECRHRGLGRQLLDFAKETVRDAGGARLKLSRIEESSVLKSWYIENGFVPDGAQKFAHLPFTTAYLSWQAEKR